MSRSISFNPARIPREDLTKFAKTVLERGPKAPAFYAWLADVIASECIRRDEGGIRDQDAPRPELPPGWRNEDIAAAIEESTLLSFSSGIAAETGKLLDYLVIHVAAYAARRLRKDARPCPEAN